MRIYLAGGESRHWLNTPLIEGENETVSRRRVLSQYGKRNQADCRGGIVPEVNNDSVPCRSINRRQLEQISSDLYSEWV